MKRSSGTEPSSGAPAAVALLVVGISLNTLGVVMVALRGIGWPGLLLMLVGIGILLVSVFRLTMDARRGAAEDRGVSRAGGEHGAGRPEDDPARSSESGMPRRDG